MSPGPNQHSERKSPTHGGAQAHGPSVVSGILVHPTGFGHGAGLGGWKAEGQSFPSCRDGLVPKVGTEKRGKGLETEVEPLGLAERKSGRQHGSGARPEERVLYKGPVQLEAQPEVR